MQYVKTTVADLESSETVYKSKTDQVSRQYRNLKELDQVIENLTSNVTLNHSACCHCQRRRAEDKQNTRAGLRNQPAHRDQREPDLADEGR